MIGIVDYNAGNIRSVERALESLNIAYRVSKNPADLADSEKLIFPGDGEARYAMEQLRLSGFDTFLKDFTASGKPLLGICIGSQIIFEHSEEGDTHCLGLIKGSIKHFKTLFSAENPPVTNLKIPHMGWNSLICTDFGKSQHCAKLFLEIPPQSDVYFVHSYVIQPENENIVAAYSDYGVKIPAVIRYKNITAFQFHPEKSGEAGLRLLRNFAAPQVTTGSKDGGKVC